MSVRRGIPPFDHGWSALRDPAGRARCLALRPLPAFHLGAGYHAATAWWLAELSRLAYRGERAAELAPAGLIERAVVHRGPTFAMLVEARGEAPFRALVFRGTDEPRDWLRNVQAGLVGWRGGGRAHRGFATTLDEVWAEVEPRLDGAPTWFAGHSLGGALATLAATLHEPAALYTFGAPRVGDRVLAAAVRTPWFRVVGGRDLVARVPPSLGGDGYAHGGTLVHLAGDDPAPPPGRRWLGPARRLTDHAPVNYCARLARACP